METLNAKGVLIVLTKEQQHEIPAKTRSMKKHNKQGNSKGVLIEQPEAQKHA